MPDSQDGIGCSGRRGEHGGSLSSWKCFPYVDVFSVTLFFCAVQTELNMTLPVVQTMLPAMSHLCQVHTINTKTHCNLALSVALMFQFVVQDTAQTQRPLPWQKPKFLLPPPMVFPFFFFLPRTPFPLSRALFLLPPCLRSQLSKYQRLACRLVTLD